MKKVKPSLAIIILVLVLAIGVGASFLYLQKAENEFAEAEKELPESAITAYLEKIQNKDFDGLYEDSLVVSKHINSKEAYIEKMESIYSGTGVSSIEFASSGYNEYTLASNGKYLATVKLQQATDGSYIASTVFSGDNNYVLEVPTGMTPVVNGITLDDSYKTESNIVASNFEGVSENSSAVRVDKYELNNLLTYPESITTAEDSSYIGIDDALSNTIYLGKANDALNDTFTSYAITCAKFPAKEASLGEVAAISVRNSDWYSRISGLQNNWFTTHSVSNFSNVQAFDVIQQSDDTAIGHVTFDYYASNGEVDRTWHGGYQMTLINESGTWKIAGFGINIDLNPASNN